MKVLSSITLTFLLAYLAQAAPLPSQGEVSEHQHGGHQHQHQHHEHHHHELETRGDKTDAAKNKAAKATRVTKEAIGKAKHPIVKALGGPPMVKQIKPSERRPNFADRRSLEERGDKTDAAKNKAAKATRVTKEAIGKAKHPIVKALGGPPMVKQIKPSERRPNFADRRSLETRGDKTDAAKNKAAKATRVTKETLGKAKHPIVKALGGPPMVKQIKQSERRPNFADRRSLETRGDKTDAAKNQAAKAARVTKETLGKAKHPIVKALGGPPMVKQIKPSERRPNFAD